MGQVTAVSFIAVVAMTASEMLAVVCCVERAVEITAVEVTVVGHRMARRSKCMRLK